LLDWAKQDQQALGRMPIECSSSVEEQTMCLECLEYVCG
jgi:hypothetical protein